MYTCMIHMYVYIHTCMIHVSYISLCIIRRKNLRKKKNFLILSAPKQDGNGRLIPNIDSCFMKVHGVWFETGLSFQSPLFSPILGIPHKTTVWRSQRWKGGNKCTGGDRGWKIKNLTQIKSSHQNYVHGEFTIWWNIYIIKNTEVKDI